MSAAGARPQPSSKRPLEVVIVGAGFGGIAAAIELRRHGITDVTILEKASDLGGTWFYNSYPGAACDVPSHLYSFSFAQRRDWTRLCSPQAEIHAYLHDVAHRMSVEQLIRTNVTVTACDWSDEDCRWSIHTAEGETLRSRRAGARDRPAAPAREARHRGRPTRSPGTASTPPNGTTTTRSPASASRSSAPARAPCSSSPRSRPRCSV